MAGAGIVAGARTPIGRLLGGLKALSAAHLGGIADVRELGIGKGIVDGGGQGDALIVHVSSS